MRIETELSGNIVISPDGKNDSIVFVRAGKVHRISERNGQLKTEPLGRAMGFLYGGTYKKGTSNETHKAEAK